MDAQDHGLQIILLLRCSTISRVLVKVLLVSQVVSPYYQLFFAVLRFPTNRLFRASLWEEHDDVKVFVRGPVRVGPRRHVSNFNSNNKHMFSQWGHQFRGM